MAKERPSQHQTLEEIFADTNLGADPLWQTSPFARLPIVDVSLPLAKRESQSGEPIRFWLQEKAGPDVRELLSLLYPGNEAAESAELLVARYLGRESLLEGIREEGISYFQSMTRSEQRALLKDMVWRFVSTRAAKDLSGFLQEIEAYPTFHKQLYEVKRIFFDPSDKRPPTGIRDLIIQENDFTPRTPIAALHRVQADNTVEPYSTRAFPAKCLVYFGVQLTTFFVAKISDTE